MHTNSNIGYGGIYPIRSVRNNNFKLIHNITPENIISNYKIKSPIWPINYAAAKVQNKIKYQRYVQRPEFELYDMVSDPLELTDLYNQSQFAEQVTELKKQLAQWMLQQEDEGLKTEKEACLHQAFSNRVCPNIADSKSLKVSEND